MPPVSSPCLSPDATLNTPSKSPQATDSACLPLCSRTVYSPHLLAAQPWSTLDFPGLLLTAASCNMQAVSRNTDFLFFFFKWDRSLGASIHNLLLSLPAKEKGKYSVVEQSGIFATDTMASSQITVLKGNSVSGISLTSLIGFLHVCICLKEEVTLCTPLSDPDSHPVLPSAADSIAWPFCLVGSVFRIPCDTGFGGILWEGASKLWL